MGLFDLFKEKRQKEEYNESHHFPIKFHNYTKEIYVKCKNLDELMTLLKEELEITDDPMPLDSFEITKLNKSNCFHIKCSNDIDFYGFHNLVNYFYKYEDERLVSKAVGLVKHSSNEGNSYYVVQDSDNDWGDTVIGVMNNGKAFSVYLPEAYEEGGNIITGENSLGGQVMSDFLRSYYFKKMEEQPNNY